MGVQSTWCLTAGKKKTENGRAGLIKVMNIDGEMFKRYVDEYPQFRRFLILRSTVRRAYFNYRLKLSSYSKYLEEKQFAYEKENEIVHEEDLNDEFRPSSIESA